MVMPIRNESQHILAKKALLPYERFFLFMELYPNSKKLISELLNIYIQNNDSFPSIFYIKGSYSEKEIAKLMKRIAFLNVSWTSSANPPRLSEHTCVKLVNTFSQ